jgi:hypothetical protein
MAERVAAPFVNNKLDKHLQFHEDKLDPTIKNNTIVLYGEKGDNGLCSVAKDHENRLGDIEKVFNRLTNLQWAIYTAIVVPIVLHFVK